MRRVDCRAPGFARRGAQGLYHSSSGGGLDAVFANTDTAMGHVWLVTAGNSRADQIATGADWLRVNLAVTSEGLGFQPLSQALQEFPEMADHYATVHKRLAPTGGTVQMLSRIGFGPTTTASPRAWGVGGLRGSRGPRQRQQAVLWGQPARVMQRMQSLQALASDEGIDLRGRQAAVAQQHLQRAQVRAVVQQVGGEAVAQAVRADPGGVDARDSDDAAAQRWRDAPPAKPRAAE